MAASVGGALRLRDADRRRALGTSLLDVRELADEVCDRSCGRQRPRGRDQLLSHLLRGLRAVLGRLLCGVEDDPVELLRDCGRDLRWSRDAVGQVLIGDGEGRLSAERGPPRQELVTDDAGRIDVRAGFRRLTADLLWGEVLNR